MRVHFHSYLLVLVFLVALGTPAASANQQCLRRTLTLTGGLPRGAIGRYETDANEFQNRPRSERPTLQIPLDSYGYGGQSLFVRYSKSAPQTWQAEIFHSDPEQSGDASPVDIFGPLGFAPEGRSINKFCGETRTAVQTPENFGDYLVLCFDALYESDNASGHQVSKVESETSQCFEVAKVLVGPEELSDPNSPFRTKIYSSDEWAALMLKRKPPSADSK